MPQPQWYSQAAILALGQWALQAVTFTVVVQCLCQSVRPCSTLLHLVSLHWIIPMGDGSFQAIPFWTPGRRLRHRASRMQISTMQGFVDYAQWAWLSGLAMVFVACMYPGHRGDRFGNQFGAGPGGLGSLKVPPAWCAERSQEYTFRAWLADVVLWAGATDLEAERHGPAVAMQVHGSARQIIREIPAHLLRNGRVNQQGQVETGFNGSYAHTG